MVNKRKIHSKIGNKSIAIMIVLAMSINVFAGCGKDSSKETGSETSQVESNIYESTEELETGTEVDESSDNTTEETESTETESTESTEVQTESIDTTEVQTEKITEIETEKSTESNNTEKNNSNTNNTSQNKPSNNTSQKENDKIGLNQDSYDYIVGGTSSQNSKEVDLAKGIIKNIIKSGMNDFEKVKAINDYMIQNVSYDMENYKNNTIPASSYTALGALEKKIAVCSGYAKMFRVLAITAGLECTYITGDTPYGYHAWNQVKVDGKWYNIDVTWNDPDCETKANGHYYCGCYEYFLLSNEDFEKSHDPSGKVNITGSSRDMEAFNKGCPYDGAAPYYGTQEEINQLVKEMIATNTMSKRILTVGYDQVEMVTNALKNNGIYVNAKVTTRDAISVYLSSSSKLRKVTIDISMDGKTYAEVQKQKVTSVSEAKKTLEEYFKNYVEPAKEYDKYNNTDLYVNAKLIKDKNFYAELYKWAYYEKKMVLGCTPIENIPVGDDVYRISLNFRPQTKEDRAYEILTSTKDIESAIKRMIQHGYKSIGLSLYFTDDKITDDSYSARSQFKEKYINALCEKYCLECEEVRLYIEENEVYIRLAANGHNVRNAYWEISKEATCVSEGLEVKICEICKKPGEQRVIPKNDNHSYYWDQKGDSRTQKCKACPYVGITEVCIGGVWGYFDEATAMEELDAINRQRASIWKSETDEWGKVIGTFSPPPLVVTSQLTEYAKIRLAALNASDFEDGVEHEYAVRYTPYSNTYKKKYAGYSNGIYHESYDKVGIICFQYDVNGDASRFSKIYVIELGLAE